MMILSDPNFRQQQSFPLTVRDVDQLIDVEQVDQQLSGAKLFVPRPKTKISAKRIYITSPSFL